MSTLSSYRQLIGRLDLDADSSQASYRQKALAVTASCPGYVAALYAFCVLLIICGVLISHSEVSFFGQLLVVAGVLLIVLITRTLWVEFLPPDGYALQKEEAPKLWKLVRKMGAKLKAPSIDEIIIDDQFGISIQQAPKWGFCGPSHTVLVLGLPWLQSLSPKQATAGIALEYAHLGIRYGKTNAWAYRTREFWLRFISTLSDEQNFFERFVTRFLVRQVPYMEAYTVPLMRDLVLTADSTAASFTGAERTAQAIERTAAIGRWLEECFWQDVFRAADNELVPSKMPHQNMAAAFRTADRSTSLRQIFKEEAVRKRRFEDTSPSVSDRLDALGQKPNPVGMPEQTAAEVLLEGQFKNIMKALDDNWLETVRGTWRHRHESVQSARLWLTNFGDRNIETLSIEDLTIHAQALLTTGDRERALPLLRRAAEHPQGTAEAAWSAAHTLLERSDAEAMSYLEIVMVRDPLRARDAAELALDMSERHGKRELISRYRRYLEELDAG